MNVSSSELPSLLNASLQRLAAQSAACKLWSIVLTSLVLAMAAGRAGAEVLIWAAAPSILFALADAAYTVQTKRLATLAAKDKITAEELFRLQTGEAGFSASIQSLNGLASFSVWPFYTALAALVMVLGHSVLPAQLGKPSFPVQSPTLNGIPTQPGASRPGFAVQQGVPAQPSGTTGYPANPNMRQPNGYSGPGGASFQPQVNQTVSARPVTPPPGIPANKFNPPGNSAQPTTVPKNTSPNINRTAPVSSATPPVPNAQGTKPAQPATQQ